MARGLGVADFGLFAALSGLALLLAEGANLGLHAVAPRALVAGEVSWQALVRAKIALSALLAGLALALAPRWPLLALLVAAGLLVGWSEFLGVLLRSLGARAAEAATILSLRAAALGLGLLALARWGGPLAVAVAQAAAGAVAIGLGAVLLGRSRRAVATLPLPDPGLASVLRYSLPLGVNGLLALTGLRLEVLAIEALRGGAEAGLFASALRLIEPLLLVPASIAAGAMPALTREAVAGEGPVRRRTAFSAALLAVPAAVGLALLAPGLLGLLFGTAYAGAALPLRILSLALVPLFMNSVLLHGLIAAGQVGRLPWLTALRLAAALLLAAALIPRFGPAGGAAGFLLAELVLLVSASRACTRAGFPIPVVEPLSLGCAASLPMAGVVALSSSPFAAVAIGGLIYAGTLLVVWRLTPRLLSLLPPHVRYS